MPLLRYLFIILVGLLPALAAITGGSGAATPVADRYQAPQVCTLGHYRGPVPAMHTGGQDQEKRNGSLSEHHRKAQSHHQTQVQLTSAFSFETATRCAGGALRKASPLPPAYRYLFFEEINPPPPKTC